MADTLGISTKITALYCSNSLARSHPPVWGLRYSLISSQRAVILTPFTAITVSSEKLFWCLKRINFFLQLFLLPLQSTSLSSLHDLGVLLSLDLEFNITDLLCYALVFLFQQSVIKDPPAPLGWYSGIPPLSSLRSGKAETWPVNKERRRRKITSKNPPKANQTKDIAHSPWEDCLEHSESPITDCHLSEESDPGKTSFIQVC